MYKIVTHLQAGFIIETDKPVGYKNFFSNCRMKSHTTA
jgi:hypothetical protein